MNEEFSVAEDLSRDVNVDVTEKQVVKHLQDNPEFFLNHPELLSNIKLPHDSGKAISLVEKQVNILREQGVKATEKLKDLTDNARTNDEIFDITRSLILDLLESNTIEEVSTSVQKQFPQLKNVDACELIFLNHSVQNFPTAIRVEDSKIMMEKKSGVIINITSINAEFAFPNNPAYQATKAGLKQLTKSLALDLAKFGIRVNSIGPGYFRTSMTKKSWDNLKRRKEIQECTMLKRWGVPKDLEGIIIFLSSDASSYITGQDIYVDGGWTAKGMR